MKSNKPPPPQVFRRAGPTSQPSNPSSGSQVFRRSPASTPNSGSPAGEGRPAQAPAAPPSGQPAPAGARPAGPGGPRGFPPRRPRGPVTPENIAALAHREKVPFRVARAELEGGAPARVWKKKHPELAKKAAAPYEMAERHGLDLEEARAIISSGLSLEEYRKGKEKRAEQSRLQKAQFRVKRARDALDDAKVQDFYKGLVASGGPCALLRDGATHLGRLLQEQKMELEMEGHGHLDKLGSVALGSRAAWVKVSAGLKFDEALLAQPLPAQKEIADRPVFDPRPFVPLQGQPLRVVLRTGEVLELPLTAVGRFDLLLGSEEAALLVPLHAIARWEPLAAPPA